MPTVHFQKGNVMQIFEYYGVPACEGLTLSQLRLRFEVYRDQKILEV